MKRVNVHGFYLFGQALHPLSEIEEESLYGDFWYELDSARGLIVEMLDSGVVPLHTCRAAMNSLIAAINEIVPGDFEKASEKDMKAGVGGYEVYVLKEALREFQTVFAAELPLLETYSVSQKGAYSTSDLIDHAEITFSEGVRALLPSDAVRDIQQAGRCIAFDVPTAAAFHILRAIEAVMLKYHDALSGDAKRPDRNWAEYIRSLRALKADETIIEELDQIREKYRNPIMHPEDVVTSDGALALFGKAQFVIYAMIEGCKSATPAQKPVKSLGRGTEKPPPATESVSSN